MKFQNNTLKRRSFFQKSLAIGALSLNTQLWANESTFAAPRSLFMIGPLEGYSPQIGTLVSMLNYNRDTVIKSVKDLTTEQIDFLLDDKANTVAALVMHLGAVEKFYQINTFEGRQEFNKEEKQLWDSAMNLGDEGRKNIKGKEVKYYLDLLAEVRQKTLQLLKTKDDKWLMAVDPEWSKEQDLNTYWKWFHVCEHESNHRGQIAFLRGRIPGLKAGKE
ncbi:MAG TPA: DinB family protein [Chryseolinea sp.]|nr:DinB family protein [Chryseolinea sp.]